MDEKKFLSQTLQHPLHIDQVVSVFYSDLGNNFISRGEKHNFWEFVYVDRGQLHVETDKSTFPLAQGQITFHPPMEYHKHISNLKHDTSLCIAAFYCADAVLAPLAQQAFTLDETQRLALSEALKYGTDIFSSLVDAQDMLYLVKKPESTPVSEEIFTNYLENFLLLCVSKFARLEPVKEISQGEGTLSRSRIEQLGQRAIDYLAGHLREQVTVPQLCAALQCSKTTLSNTFRAYTGSSIIPYFNRLKIEAAKTMIRSEDVSLTEIAARLNFCNLNYFSTAFQHYTGMYPREYAKSLKVHNGVYLVNPEHDAILHHQ